MVIRIDDAPAIRNIKIDISFEDGNVINTGSTCNTGSMSDNTGNTYQNTSENDGDTYQAKTQTFSNDVGLDLDETFEVPAHSEEIVQAPIIEDIKREVKVSTDMVEEEF